MNIEDFFNQFPIQKPVFLTNEDLAAILLFSYGAAKLYKKDDTSMSKEEKIESYKVFYREKISKNYENLEYNGKIELDKFFNLYGTYCILNHLSEL